MIILDRKRHRHLDLSNAKYHQGRSFLNHQLSSKCFIHPTSNGCHFASPLWLLGVFANFSLFIVHLTCQRISWIYIKVNILMYLLISIKPNHSCHYEDLLPATRWSNDVNKLKPRQELGWRGLLHTSATLLQWKSTRASVSSWKPHNRHNASSLLYLLISSVFTGRHRSLKYSPCKIFY